MVRFFGPPCTFKVYNTAALHSLWRFIGGATVKIYRHKTTHKRNCVLLTFTQYLLGMKETSVTNLFAAVTSCAFLFLKRCSFQSRFTILLHWNFSLCAIWQIVLWVFLALSFYQLSQNSQHSVWRVNYVDIVSTLEELFVQVSKTAFFKIRSLDLRFIFLRQILCTSFTLTEKCWTRVNPNSSFSLTRLLTML